jgi:hypothetical protein
LTPTSTNNTQRCTYCPYRDATGTLTITDHAGTTTAPACHSCTTEAHALYGTRATLTPAITL